MFGESGNEQGETEEDHRPSGELIAWLGTR